MVVRTPPAHIYTSTLRRRERTWERGRRAHRRRGTGRARGLATLGLSLLVVALLSVALFASAAS